MGLCSFTLDGPVILMLRTYAFSGRRRPVLVILSIPFFTIVGFVVWVVSKQLNRPSPVLLDYPIFSLNLKLVTGLFIIRERSGCFATSNQSVSGAVRAVGAYQLGVRAKFHLHASEY